jgi:hypothetical protein
MPVAPHDVFGGSNLFQRSEAGALQLEIWKLSEW